MSESRPWDARRTPGKNPVAALIADLAVDLAPVRRVPSPWLRAFAWIALVGLAALAMSTFADMPAIAHRLTAAPDMWLAVVGSASTAVLGAIATFQLGLPDRSPRWVALPLPGLALWIGESGIGCARQWLVPGTQDASMIETMHCLRFILLLSIPLSLAIFWLLRRGYSLYPTLAGATAGLTVASAAATLLIFFHPFDASLVDIAVHALAVTIVVLVDRWMGARVFGHGRAITR